MSQRLSHNVGTGLIFASMQAIAHASHACTDYSNNGTWTTDCPWKRLYGDTCVYSIGGTPNSCTVSINGCVAIHNDLFDPYGDTTLTINGAVYNGTHPPESGYLGTIGGEISWQTDSSQSEWLLCLEVHGENLINTTDNASEACVDGVNDGNWSSDCPLDSSDDHCVEITGGTPSSCTIWINGCQILHNDGFVPDGDNTTLTINGTAYNGSSLPPSYEYGTITGEITWQTESSQSYLLLCFEQSGQAVAPTTPTTTTEAVEYPYCAPATREIQQRFKDAGIRTQKGGCNAAQPPYDGR